MPDISPFTLPFAYNTGSTISNTLQIGQLAIATGSTLGGNVQWWNGPDFQLGYVIARALPAKTQPTPVAGLSAYTAFWRSDLLTDASYVEMANDFKPKFTAGAPQVFEVPEQVATWANYNQFWTSWLPYINQILYSGNSYTNLWTSGETSSGVGVTVTYQRGNDLGIVITVGFGSASGRWVTQKMYNLTNFDLLSVEFTNNGTFVDIIIFNGQDENILTSDSGSGFTILTTDISSYGGYWYIIIKSNVTGTGESGDISISLVSLVTNATVVNPYPYPIFTNVQEYNATPIVFWDYTGAQFTNINQAINIYLSYDDTNIRMYYIVSATLPSYTNDASPASNGFTSIDPNNIIQVDHGYYVYFGVQALTIGSGSYVVNVVNNSSNDVSLGTFNASYTVSF